MLLSVVIAQSSNIARTYAVASPKVTEQGSGIALKDLLQIGLFLCSLIGGIWYVADRQGKAQGALIEAQKSIKAQDNKYKEIITETKEARGSIKELSDKLSAISERLIVIETTCKQRESARQRALVELKKGG
ncbi:MAG: hypothetical protein KKB59_20200 [Spirochaetes bacterium]|nr:hypothetical protein [Spirochaetota bacterium]